MLNNKEMKINMIIVGILVVFSILLGLIYSLASELLAVEQLGIKMTDTIIFSCVCFFILMLVFNFIQRVDNIQTYKTYPFIKKESYIIFVISLCVNLVCFFTYFPGVGMNDGLNILYYGMSQSQQFPVFYCMTLTILKKIGLLLGSLQYSIAIYSILQIICISLLYTWIGVWFSKKCAPKILKYIVLMYLLLEPLLAMYAISMLKDTLFSLLLLVLMMIVYDLVIERKVMTRKDLLFFAVVLFGVLSLRNNGSYIVFPVLIILLVCFSKNRKKIIYMIIFSVFIMFIQKIMMMYFGEEQLFQEAVGIPLQQMAAVVANGGKITTEQKEFLNNLMPLKKMAEQYSPETVDAIKWNSMFNRTYLNEHKVQFLVTWFDMLVNNFLIYVKAYLQQTFWFWAPLQEGTVQCFYSIETVANNAWLEKFLVTSGIHDQSLFPDSWNNVLRIWYGWGSKFFREGVCFWIMFSSLILTVLKNRNGKIILVYIPALLLWITIMISTPVASSMRYVFVLAYALPFFIGLPFIKMRINRD